jgi:glutamate 5-kinase
VRNALLTDLSRIVVKLGTGVLTDSRKQLDLAQMEQLVAQVAAQRQAGKQMVLVASGALGCVKRPAQLAELQDEVETESRTSVRRRRCRTRLG